jgi:hypothetical protein
MAARDLFIEDSRFILVQDTHLMYLSSHTSAINTISKYTYSEKEIVNFEHPQRLRFLLDNNQILGLR